MSDDSSRSDNRDDAAAARAKLMTLSERISRATIDVVWRQWSAIGGMATTKHRAKSLVDPEALVLISLTLLPTEPRLGDLVADWTARNSDLLSVQRLRNLERRYPTATRERLQRLARVALEEGKDHRWKSLLGDKSGVLTRRGTKSRAVRAQAVESPAAVLRFRLAFGVGIKADLFSYLLSTDEGAGASVAVISLATGYTVAAVRRAASDLAEAHFILPVADDAAIADTRIHYRVQQEGWREVLGIEHLAKWRGWNERFVFVAAFLDWVAETADRPLTAYVLESRGRDLIEEHLNAFRWQRVWQSENSDRGAGRDGVLTSAVGALGTWMLREV
jgi:hypothetical protein